jgi:hypothetical protein
MSILFSEADKSLLNKDKTININKLSPEQQQVLEYSRKDPDETMMNLSKPLTASYKIQVVFDSEKSQKNLTPCILTCWESSGHLSEHNDKILYLCRSNKDASLGCGYPFLEDPKHCFVNGIPTRLFVCKNCPKVNNEYRLINPNKAVTDVFLRMPYKKLAEVIYDYFRKLNGDADIYIKNFKFKYRDTSSLLGEKEFVIYRLADIIRDSSNDSLILKKIEGFLTA